MVGILADLEVILRIMSAVKAHCDLMSANQEKNKVLTDQCGLIEVALHQLKEDEYLESLSKSTMDNLRVTMNKTLEYLDKINKPGKLAGCISLPVR
jgi:hypothetical protein